jgi:D-threo-aldose 1-dehydrogenase
MDHTQRDYVGPRSLQLTKLGYGGAPIGNLNTSVTDAAAHSAMQAAWQAGIRYFDTAPWYGLGLSEHRVGRFLRDKPKAEYVLSTKVGRLLRPWPPRYGPRVPRSIWAEPLSFEVRFDYSYDGIVRSYEDSLQRLGLPEVDILLIHDLDRIYHSPEGSYQARLGQLTNGGFAALRDLRTDGKIGAIGAGINTPGVITDLLDRFDLDLFLVAGPYTLLNQEIFQTELDRCHKAGIRIVIGAAFRYGLLTMEARNRERNPPANVDAETLERVTRLEAACTRSGVALPAAALQFPAAHPAVAAVLFGAIDASQVDQAISWFDAGIPASLWHDLKDQGLLPRLAPVPGAGPDVATPPSEDLRTAR